jgi:hypothetical protein
MSENVAPLHGGLIPIKEMKIRAADGAGGDLDDGVARMLDLWVGDGIYPDVAFGIVPLPVEFGEAGIEE